MNPIPRLDQSRDDLALDRRLGLRLVHVPFRDRNDHRQLGDQRLETVFDVAGLHPGLDLNLIAPVGQRAIARQHTIGLDHTARPCPHELIEQHLVARDRLGVDLNARDLLQRLALRIDHRLVLGLGKIAVDDGAEAVRLADVDVALLAARRRLGGHGGGCDEDEREGDPLHRGVTRPDHTAWTRSLSTSTASPRVGYPQTLSAWRPSRAPGRP